MIPAYMVKRIQSELDAKKFICDLYFDDKMFHFASPAEDIVNINGEQAFNEIECALLEQRVEEVFDYIKDPFELCLALVNESNLK